MSNASTAAGAGEAIDIASIPTSKLDPSKARYFADNSILEVFRRLRAESPIHWTESENWGSFWSLSRYEDIKAVETNHKVFSSDVSWGGVGLSDMPKETRLPMFLSSDEPKHTQQRKTVEPIFKQGGLARFATLIRERASKLLDEVPINEPFDWVDRISIELTTQMLTTLFDFPWEDRRKLTRWSDVAASTPEDGTVESEEQKQAELMECLGYFRELWNERANSEPGHDFISMLAHGESTRNMSQMEFLGNVILLMVGGNDTTRNSITGGLYGLNLFPEQYAKVREDRALIPNMVSEIIRWQTPIAYQRRTAVCDTEINGTPIKRGERVAMWYVSGNRDEAIFDRADELIIDRHNARDHISFGFGIHRCFGLRFAEMQLGIVWEEILKRWDYIEVLEPPVRHNSNIIHGYRSMPVIIRA